LAGPDASDKSGLNVATTYIYPEMEKKREKFSLRDI
jgi:hypothetical protein